MTQRTVTHFFDDILQATEAIGRFVSLWKTIQESIPQLHTMIKMIIQNEMMSGNANRPSEGE